MTPRTWAEGIDAEAVLSRLLAKVEQISETGCWIWTGSETSHGYGTFSVGGKRKSTHRAMYELVKGPIPEGLVIDHMCRVTVCINPDHLRAITNRENLLCGDTLPARQLKRNCCRRGHPYVGAVRSDGSRHCRVCKNMLQNIVYQKRKFAALERGRK